MSIKCDTGTHCELNKGSMILLQMKKKGAGPQAIITGFKGQMHRIKCSRQEITSIRI